MNRRVLQVVLLAAGVVPAASAQFELFVVDGSAERPAALAVSFGLTLAMASPVTGTKNMTIKGPDSRVGRAICRKVTSELNDIRQIMMKARPTERAMVREALPRN